MENDLKKINLTCSVCGNRDVRFWIKKNSFDLYKCGKCGLIFTELVPDVSKIYSEDYFSGAKNGFGYVDYDFDKEAMAGTFNLYLDKIEEFLPNKGKILDVGAATGYFLKIAEQRKWDVKGIDISEYASKKARAKGLEVIAGTLESANLSSESFDVLTFFDIIEHFPDPKTQLLSAHEILRKDGLIVINTPDSGSLFARMLGRHWHLLVPPEHLMIFNLNNLSIFLKSCGFEILLVNKIGKRFTLQYIFQILANWQKSFLTKKLAGFFANGFLNRISIPVNLRDNFFVIARKK